MTRVSVVSQCFSVIVLMVGIVGCNRSSTTPASGPAPAASPVPSSWLGIPSAVTSVVEYLHEGTGWLLNKSEVSVKKVGDARPVEGKSAEFQANYQITVSYGGESFETTAVDVPCDRDGIPTEASVDRLRIAVEDIKTKMKKLQH